MRHMLWFDPTEDYHTYSILWNNHQIVFFVDRVPIRVFRNNGKENNFFPNEKPMYLFSSIWNADDWATRGGLEKTNRKVAPFVSSYKDFNLTTAPLPFFLVLCRPVLLSLASPSSQTLIFEHGLLLIFLFLVINDNFGDELLF
ncbi:probable xyloglucan endotransglucosylase/hydrolase protein 8 [Arachis duranensis]|uniref:Probable xyloglucan endotransglucosylase/hydrolase protein 8 n=1 Tax=Arachis duranensis TaxID=130453 RepID=A0A6P4BHB2_ARADU|nr:probable xyloglucan endotransglucosylase/hydrolase protein 8 [Arachis duranensis]